MGASPTRPSLQPEAIGAVMEVAKWLKSSVCIGEPRLPLWVEVVWKLFIGDRDEILRREFGLRRNNESPMPPSGFNYCAEGIGLRVFTQPGPFVDRLECRLL